MRNHPAQSDLRRAFTYIELMVVATVIAVLAAIAVPNFLEAKVRAGVARGRADLTSIRVALEAYRLEERRYPPNTIPGVPAGEDLLRLTTPVAYLTSLPLDFFTTADGLGRHADRNVPADFYLYLNGIQDGGTGITVIAASEALGGFIPALLWGIGPGGALNTRHPGRVTEVEHGGVVRSTLYDPTNGTTSRGDILQPAG